LKTHHVRALLSLVLLTSVVGSTRAMAGIVLGAGGAGLGSANLYEGPVTYANFDFPGSMTFDGTIVTKSFEKLGAIDFAVQFTPADLDFTGASNFNGGFRWSERVTNNTSSNVTGLLLDLDPTSRATFLDLNAVPSQPTKIVPTYAIITGGGTPTVTRDTAFPGGLSLSGDGKHLMFFFNAPVAPSQQIQLHVPINNLDDSTSFGLSQRLIPQRGQNGGLVPEPTTLITWIVLASIGGCVQWKRRNLS